MTQDDEQAKKTDFATLYEQSFSGMASFKPGQAVETQILSISKDWIFLEVSGKSEGILARDEVTGKDGQLTVKAGDRLKVFFLKAENGELLFTTRLNGESAGPDLLEQAYHQKIPVEGVVEKEIKGGYSIKIGETRAFCPYSQMGKSRTEDASQYVGHHLTFRIQEYKENGRNILVSNRILHEEARQVLVETLKRTLQEGAVVQGTVQSLQDFGAFVDVQGVQALLPISEVSRSRIEDLRTVLSVGQQIQASVLRLDWKNERITLSLKSLLADPWDEAVAKYAPGSKHQGRVVRLTDFGAFVSLEQGLDGLIHVSEFRSSSRYDNSAEIPVKVGQTVSVQILSVDRAQRRIALKPGTSREEDATNAQYLEGSSDGTTYNPFATMLKKK